MKLHEFRFEPESVASYKEFCQPSSVTVKVDCWESQQEAKLAIMLTRAYKSGDIVTNKNTRAAIAARKAVANYIASKKEEICQVAIAAAEASLIESAKEVAPEAISILSLANQ